MYRVVLIDPKFPFNVGGALRACAEFGADSLHWTGDRVRDERKVAKGSGRKGWRLPREERMKDYQRVAWGHDDTAATRLGQLGTPVCVEVMDNTESLFDFEHPEDAVYVFGPEDSGVPKVVRKECHRFVRIPTPNCLNLAAAVNVVLYDRALKAHVGRPIVFQSQGYSISDIVVGQ